MRRTAFFLMVLFSLITLSRAETHAALSLQERLNNADELVNLFVHHYGPLPWKRAYLGIALDQMTTELKARVMAAKTDEAHYDALFRFLSGFHDRHLVGQIPSTYETWLGFTVDDFDGVVLITGVDRQELPEAVFPFAIGDRLVAMDGRPVEAVMRELTVYKDTGHPIASCRFAARGLTARKQWFMPIVPRGSAQLEIVSEKEGALKTVTLPWRHKGYPLAAFQERFSPTTLAMADLLASATGASDEDREPRDGPLWQWTHVTVDREADGASYPLTGKVQPFFSLGAGYVERTTEPFISGIIVAGGYRIGFLRLHTWDTQEDLNEKEVIEFLLREIPYLERESDALIIDQTYNPGGNICLGEAVAGFFFDHPIAGTALQAKPTRLWAIDLEKEYLDAKKVSAKERVLMQEIIAMVRAALHEGKELTDPIPSCSPDGMITPWTTDEGDLVAYRKPKLLLVNELSCSTGDMFPAILQDAGVPVFGERTSGCGGNVETIEKIGRSDFSVRMTMSLAVRPKAVATPRGITTRYIENVGVIPDIPYKMTARDFRNGYRDYREAILASAIKLVEEDRKKKDTPSM